MKNEKFFCFFVFLNLDQWSRNTNILTTKVELENSGGGMTEEEQESVSIT